MAIQRCPYCKAIIDEGAEYCTNCGTKLLFPEDELIDEEIPGEKIIDVDEDISGLQQELKEKTGELPSDEEEKPLEEELPGEEAADVTSADKSEDEVPAEEDESELEKEIAAIEAELLEEEAKEPEKKPAPKKKAAPRKRKSTRKKPAAKKPKKEAPVKVVEDEEPEPVEPEEPAEPEAAAEAPEQSVDELESVPEEQEPASDEPELAADAVEPEEEIPGAEVEAAPEEEALPAEDIESDSAVLADEVMEEPVPEAEAPVEDKTEFDVEPQEIQEEVAEEEAEIRDTRHGLTEDLPDGFAEVIDDARERSGDPLEMPMPQEIDEAPEEEDSEEEMLTPEPGTVEEKEWQTPPPLGEVLTEPGTQDEEGIQTGDIEDIVDEAEKEKEEIDDFIASIKQERRSVRDQIKSDTQDIPPWVENVQDGPLPDIPPTDEIKFDDRAVPEEPEEVEAVEPLEIDEVVTTEEAPSAPVEEEIPEAPGPGYDTRSAFPETVDQAGLPFVKTSELAGEDADEGILSDAIEEAAEEEPVHKKIRVRRQSHPVGFGDWIKARAFDVVFVSVLWFVALWIASQVVGGTVFQLLAGSAPVAILFLGVLLLIYFFFFLYFLGETLGNYLFSSDE